MYPKTYFFHKTDLEGLDHLVSSPVTLTYSTTHVYNNQKMFRDMICMINLYNACNTPISAKYITCIYNSKPSEMLAIILKFGALQYCHIKSDEHFKLAKSLENINKKIEDTMQNISGLESNMRSCYQSLEALDLQIKSPMYCEEIESLSHALSVRKVARNKLNDLIHSEFIPELF